MQASVRTLSLVAVGAAALALMMVAGAPAALAYDDGPTPNEGKVFKAWNPQYTVVQFARKISNEGGPVELPHPVDPAPGSFSGSSSMMPEVGGKADAIAIPSGALPSGRGGGAILDPATRAQRSIQQVIRRLG